METEKSVFKKIGTMAVLIMGSKLVRLVVVMFSARFLTPEEFGTIAAFSMVLSFSYLVANMGLIQTIIQRPIISDKHLGSSLVLSILFCSLVFSFLILLSPFISEATGVRDIEIPLQVSSVLFFILAFGNVSSAILQKSGEIVYIAKIQAFSTIFCNVFVTVPLIYFNLGYWSIITSMLLAEVMSTTCIIFKGKTYIKFNFGRTELKEILKYSLYFMSNNIIGLFSKQLDIMIIGRKLGSGDLGNYSRAIQLVEFPSQVYILIFERVIYPSMSSMKSKKKSLDEFFWDMFSILLLGLTILSIILCIGSKDIVTLLMGSNWGVVANLFAVLSISIMFRCASGYIESLLSALGCLKTLNSLQILSVIILFVFIWSSLDLGLERIALYITIAYFIKFIIYLSVAFYHTNSTLKELYVHFIPSLLAALFILGVFYFLGNIFYTSELFLVLVASLVWFGITLRYTNKTMLSKFGEVLVISLKRKILLLNNI